MKKAEALSKLEEIKERSINFLNANHTRWEKADPCGLADKYLQASEIINGIQLIEEEIYFISEDSEFEILKKGEFERYVSILRLMRREDIKSKTAKWRELLGNIENIEVIYNEPSYKFGVLNIYCTPKVYVIYTSKL